MAAAKVWVMRLKRVPRGALATGQRTTRRLLRNQPTPDWAINGAKNRHRTSRFVHLPGFWTVGDLSGAGRTSGSENWRIKVPVLKINLHSSGSNACAATFVLTIASNASERTSPRLMTTLSISISRIKRNVMGSQHDVWKKCCVGPLYYNVR